MTWMLEGDKVIYHGNYDCTAAVIEERDRKWVAEVISDVDEDGDLISAWREVGRYKTLIEALKAADEAIPDAHRYDDDDEG
jgi:hypothetical protein